MRILIVEDYAPLRKSLVLGLREAGLAVDESGDGEEGLWFATSNAYDVIVLDLMLPGLDGLTILKRLREKDCSAHILILTARDAVEDRIQGLNAGADDYLAKPFAFDELLARIRALVRRAYKAKSPTLRVADLEIDTSARTVQRAGDRIELTSREYALLECLALHIGEPVSRTQLWEHCYDFQAEANSNVIDVYIGYLRRKIERTGLPKLIHTRRGQGYVLEAQT
jgi:DNA-binding response OmpR family regulator